MRMALFVAWSDQVKGRYPGTQPGRPGHEMLFLPHGFDQMSKRYIASQSHHCSYLVHFGDRGVSVRIIVPISKIKTGHRAGVLTVCVMHQVNMFAKPI